VKAIAIVGSPRKKGNTEILSRHALKAIEEEGLETELISLAGLDISPAPPVKSARKKSGAHSKMTCGRYTSRRKRPML